MIPLFTSEYSIGESILTIEPPFKPKKEGDKPEGPKSILDIAIKHKLESIFLVEENPSGFLTALNNFKAAKIKLCFGLKLIHCADVADKSPKSRETESKVIIFLRAGSAYENFIKIWNRASTQHFYYKPRIDSQVLKELWNDGLLLMFPFYSSFLARNCLTLNNCIFDYSFTNPIFAIENSRLPFDPLLEARTKGWAEKNNHEIQQTRTVYFDSYEDFKAFQVARCIQEKSEISRPELSHFSSNAFCFEEFCRQSGLAYTGKE